MSTASAQAATGEQAASVTRIARRRPRPGQAPAYEALAREMLAAMRQWPGFQRGELIPPAEADGDYHLISRWDSESALRGWDDSPERAAILARKSFIRLLCMVDSATWVKRPWGRKRMMTTMMRKMHTDTHWHKDFIHL